MVMMFIWVIYQEVEKYKMFIQNIFNKMNIHKLFSINMINKFGKFGDLFRPNFINFPGSNIKLNNYFDLVSYFIPVM